MPSVVAYREKISGYGWKDLNDLWGQIKWGHTPDWPSGWALEYLILQAFHLGGAVVRWPYEVRLWEESEIVEQIDGAVHVHGLHCLIESKDRGDPVNIEPVAKLRNHLLRRPAGTIGVVFSRGEFTSSAVKLAQFAAHEGIMLWNGDEIEYALSNCDMIDGLMVKYRGCVEFAYPLYSLIDKELP